LESNELIWTQVDGLSEKSLRLLVISPDDRFLALSGSMDAEVCFFDFKTGQLYARFLRTAEANVIEISF